MSLSTSVFHSSRCTISIDMKTWVSDFQNRYEIKLLGVSMSPCKTVLWPLEGRRRPSHTTSSKKFPNIPKHLNNDHVEMSKKPHQKRPELPGGKVMGST